MRITKLDQMFEVLKTSKKKRLVAAYANDEHSISAVNLAIEMGLIEGTLVGDKKEIEKVCHTLDIDTQKFTIVHEPDEMKAALKAVELIHSGEGNLLMKGLVSTDKYMRAILDKEKGLMNKGAVLSHVTVMENPHYHKLLIVGDVAILPAPELPEKVAITNYLIHTAHALGIETPKVALIAASEQVSPKIQASIDASVISKMADRGQIKGAFVDGPLALDVAIDKESAEIKKIGSQVAGDADCLVFPNIEAGNVFYKTNTKLSGGEQGAIVVGARVPAVLSSRGDSTKTKLYSIALAALTAN
ncbi:MAG: bifunctional enoyl-CoA hydratase/phosphate acetyltransferase [Bacteroidales bacterium]|jgi:phosphate butyryltransferase|nr:bifunctional enoyl-CoA hydratase/phosphate acetyltransferase [Bacteroidales bacterium]MDD3702114.1 bifunctional enoyl-CoA hydratase/phosphate acetyltransferase [Bacteroidales bacterium]MDY0369599.1 bifunctional enoyl-CoA hydratase/phosphate acetyltransferase [Bacteroidales bacterium]